MSNVDTLPELDPQLIRDYLADHPDFFQHNSDLLRTLKLPHGEQGTVSLVQRQQSILRQRAEQLEEEITTLMSRASKNEGLYRFYTELMFELLECKDPNELQQHLTSRLRQHFQFTRARLLMACRCAEWPHVPAILNRRLNADGYYLGRLPSVEAKLLLEQETGSVVLIGLGEPGHWSGVLAIASHDPGHFQPDMGTLLLDQLRRLVSFQLRQWGVRG